MVINRINIEDNKGASYEKILKTLQMAGTKIIFSSCGNSGMHVVFFCSFRKAIFKFHYLPLAILFERHFGIER